MTDRDEIIINPCRGKGEPEIPATGIICLNPGDALYLVKKAKESAGRRQFLFNSNLQILPAGEDRQAMFVAGPAVGAPMAVMTLEKLIALGCRRVVVWGWCGALVAGVNVGDILLPITGFSEEGTSQHYPAAVESKNSLGWRRHLQSFLVAERCEFREGAVWSTDAPYRESRSKVEKYATLGALAVEMEFTALAAVAAFRGIELGAMLIISDELWGGGWRPGFQQPPFKQKSRAVLDALFDWLRKFNG